MRNKELKNVNKLSKVAEMVTQPLEDHKRRDLMIVHLYVKGNKISACLWKDYHFKLKLTPQISEILNTVSTFKRVFLAFVICNNFYSYSPLLFYIDSYL